MPGSHGKTKKTKSVLRQMAAQNQTKKPKPKQTGYGYK